MYSKIYSIILFDSVHKAHSSVVEHLVYFKCFPIVLWLVLSGWVGEFMRAVIVGCFTELFLVVMQ